MRLLIAFVVALTTTLSATVAFAQGMSIAVVNEQSLPRLDANGNPIAKRPLQLTPEGVNLQDCIDDQRIRFTLQMAGFEQNARVEVWASTSGDCKQESARASASQLCWKVGSNVPLKASLDADLRVREIMSGYGHPATKNDSPDLCGTVDLASIVVHFLYFPPGQTIATVDKAITVNVDTVGPDPPSGLRALPGNGRIRVTWNQISGGSGDVDASSSTSSSGSSGGGIVALTGVKVYCDPDVSGTTTTPAPPICTEVPNEAGATTDEAGTDEAGTVDAGTTTVCEDGGTVTEDAECASSNFTPTDGGVLFPTADFNAKFECGSITGNTGTTVDAEEVNDAPLQNGKRYAVAVAGTDAYGNVGRLSDPLCEIPQVTTDFWEDYRNASGGAGGGCAVSGSEATIGSMTLIGLFVAFVLSPFRRRNRR